MKTRLALLAPVLVLAACSTRLSDQVDKDLTATLLSQKSPVAACYAEALERDADTHGSMTLSAEVAGDSGEFENVRVVTSDVEDVALEVCAVEQGNKLQLDEPSGTRIAVTYPLVFKPAK